MFRTNQIFFVFVGLILVGFVQVYYRVNSTIVGYEIAALKEREISELRRERSLKLERSMLVSKSNLQKYALVEARKNQ